MIIKILIVQSNYFIMKLDTIEEYNVIITLLRNNFITFDSDSENLKIYAYNLAKVIMSFKNSKIIKKILII